MLYGVRVLCFTQDCRSALRVKPNLLRAITLLGHACLRMGLHAEASQFLHDGLALAMASGGALATGLQLKPLRYGSGGGGGCVSVSVGVGGEGSVAVRVWL